MRATPPLGEPDGLVRNEGGRGFVLCLQNYLYLCDCKDILKITDMLEREFKYYLDNQEELVKKYNNRVVVIVDNEVIGDYDSPGEAISETAKIHEPGTFLVQLCTEGDSAYTQRFYSRVIFA
jgi:hypothetical protein